jgi:hypothetical protein
MKSIWPGLYLPVTIFSLCHLPVRLQIIEIIDWDQRYKIGTIVIIIKILIMSISIWADLAPVSQAYTQHRSFCSDNQVI